jgi:OOP family OmpA-OmpF porin
MKYDLRTLSLVFSVTFISGLVYAGSKAPNGYVSDSNGNIVRNSYGECWHTGTWTKADAVVVGCDGVVAKPETPAMPAAEKKSEASTNQSSTASAAADKSVKSSAPSASVSGAAPVPASEKVTFETDTLFGFDKAELQSDGLSKLEDLVSKLQGTDIEIIVVTGHTDSTGPASYNDKLSKRRAQAARNFLVSKGLPADRIFAKGKGEQQPIASNKTSAGRAKNRRVEVEVVGKRTK